MSLVEKIARSNFLIKLQSWEYWPFGIVQFPAIMYWLYLSLRARSLVFFSAANPRIIMGGMFGESKFDILRMIPPELVPRTIRLDTGLTSDEVKRKIIDAKIKLPAIFKPDIGERGFMVKRIETEAQIQAYLQESRSSFLVQELVEEPFEFSVFYVRIPDEPFGRVISVVAKEMLSVTGDGRSSLRELIFASDRAKLQWEKLRVAYEKHLDEVIPQGRRFELVSIGNHCLGTRFINANHLINERLSHTFDEISKSIPEFYFGRYDLRCPSLEDLYEGKVRIMELNGCGAEPAHIYDSDFSLWKACRVLIEHWKYIFKIARVNRRMGIPYVSHRDAIAYYRKFKSAVKS